MTSRPHPPAFIRVSARDEPAPATRRDDAPSRRLLAELFPERRVVGIHSLDLVLVLGSVHGSTHHEPWIGP